MMDTRPVLRRFRVHSRPVDSHHARVVTEASFEAAVIAYIEDFPSATEGAEHSVIVREIDSGREQCFRVDLVTGETVLVS
jgi:hypothetical protein